ncbi:hypothetical protein JT359_17755 [Candidatus Poribacteria bacterium]|nr:hypothetical protein [Candidatus Poribacteria bacterium]
MNNYYRYEGVHLKPQIAEKLILKLYSGKTITRGDIDKGVSQYHKSAGGLPSTAKTTPIRTALRYLKKNGLAENISKGPGSTWRISNSVIVSSINL